MHHYEYKGFIYAMIDDFVIFYSINRFPEFFFDIFRTKNIKFQNITQSTIFVRLGLGMFRFFKNLFFSFLEGGLSARSFRPRSFFSNLSIPFLSWCSKLGSFLRVQFVLMKERLFPMNNAQP